MADAIVEKLQDLAEGQIVGTGVDVLPLITVTNSE